MCAFFVPISLLGIGCSYGTYAVASATLDAGIGIDDVFVVTSGDSGYGALCLASAAADALIINYICHE